MSKLARDILDGSRVIISKKRNSRPIESKDKANNEIFREYSEDCPFCRGNEYMTMEDTFIIEEDNKFLVKSVLNKYPIIDKENIDEVYGIHEVMIDTYRHNGNFYNMSTDEFYNLLIMYKDRYRSLSEEKNCKYVCIFKNYLREAGASLSHPHSQIISLPWIPPELKKEYEISEEYFDKMGINMYELIIEKETKEEKRVIHNSKNYFVFIPEVGKFSSEVIIIFKKKIEFQCIDNNELIELSVILYKLFKNMYKDGGNCPFNLYIHTHPINENKKYNKIFNVHIHITPRRFNLGGFELSTGLYVSPGCDEELVKKLRFD